jgi:long-chain acyl-CoA synthetase
MPPEMTRAKPGSSGRPSLNAAIRIVGESGAELPPGSDGEIFVRAPSVTAGYWDDPELTAQQIVDDWLHTGDIGRLDEDGYLYLTDRQAHMIISGGVNVYPQEAENILSIHPKVADVAVFGIPDEEMGEQVKAVVQPVSMDLAGPGLEAELIEYCRSRLAPYKCPKSIDFREELPRQPTGKLYKRLLRDEYWPAKQP